MRKVEHITSRLKAKRIWKETCIEFKAIRKRDYKLNYYLDRIFFWIAIISLVITAVLEIIDMIFNIQDMDSILLKSMLATFLIGFISAILLWMSDRLFNKKRYECWIRTFSEYINKLDGENEKRKIVPYSRIFTFYIELLEHYSDLPRYKWYAWLISKLAVIIMACLSPNTIMLIAKLREGDFVWNIMYIIFLILLNEYVTFLVREILNLKLFDIDYRKMKDVVELKLYKEVERELR